MHRQIQAIREETKTCKIYDYLPSVIVIGKSLLTKKTTFKIFSKIINKFGQLNDFNSHRKNGYRFYSKSSFENILQLIKQLQAENYIEVESITDYRKERNSADSLMLNMHIRMDEN